MLKTIYYLILELQFFLGFLVLKNLFDNFLFIFFPFHLFSKEFSDGRIVRIIRGKHKLSFDPAEPERYRNDVPEAEIHVVDGAISPWTRRQMRSLNWRGTLSLLEVAAGGAHGSRPVYTLGECK